MITILESSERTEEAVRAELHDANQHLALVPVVDWKPHTGLATYALYFRNHPSRVLDMLQDMPTSHFVKRRVPER